MPTLKSAVVKLAERGLSPVSINVYLRCFNAFLKCMHDEQHIRSAVHVPPLKVEKEVLAVLTAEQVQRLVSYAPQRRALFQYISVHGRSYSDRVFCTASGKALSQGNGPRDLKRIELKIGAPHLRFHLLRHTFATEYT